MLKTAVLLLTLSGALVLDGCCLYESHGPSEQAQAETSIARWAPLGISPDEARQAMQ